MDLRMGLEPTMQLSLIWFAIRCLHQFSQRRIKLCPFRGLTVLLLSLELWDLIRFNAFTVCIIRRLSFYVMLALWQRQCNSELLVSTLVWLVRLELTSSPSQEGTLTIYAHSHHWIILESLVPQTSTKSKSTRSQFTRSFSTVSAFRHPSGCTFPKNSKFGTHPRIRTSIPSGGLPA